MHSKGIMHRDLKPINLVIDHPKRKMRIIDFGLSEFYVPYQSYTVRVATKQYKGPELLLNQTIYDYSLDTWSAGAMFAGMLFKENTFFKGENNMEVIRKIESVVGSVELLKYI